ncbi:uncharacterized protein EV422DRAFT_585389, partial [Fimicolochytrium jonesii]|uniref:uncharacterized protein n=1 Tax=Fimicolochytrium jonesii TaxID=1396493 RepID=UPI0022FE35C2
MLVGKPNTVKDACDSVPLFNPPLWIQRRALVSQILLKHHVQSVLDMGCGEGSLLEILLNEPAFTRLAGVDVDENVLEVATYNCAPTDYDRTYLRELPVEFDLYRGSAGEFDKRLSNFDAIASVEVVEHLDADILATFPSTTLGAYRPRIMVVTTPNAEFNIHFPNLCYGTPESKFRHWDHRFEWTRAEFQEWATKAAAKYGYSVTFNGVGLIAAKSEAGVGSVGHCTQVAVFLRNEGVGDAALHVPTHLLQPGKQEPGIDSGATTEDVPPSNNDQHPYTHFAKIDFPHFQETGFTDADIIDELKRRASTLVWNERYSRLVAAQDSPTPDETSHDQFPLEQFWNALRIRQLCKTRARLIHLLSSDPAAPFFSLSTTTIVPDHNPIVKILYTVPAEPTPPPSTSPSSCSSSDHYEEEDAENVPGSPAASLGSLSPRSHRAGSVDLRAWGDWVVEGGASPR